MTLQSSVPLSSLMHHKILMQFYRFLFKPITLTALGIALAALAYVAMSSDVLEEGQDKSRWYVFCCIIHVDRPLLIYTRGVYAGGSAFLLFTMLHARDGPFIRPHPAFWRIVLGINLLYVLGMVFLLFQNLSSARQMMTFLDPALGVPLEERSYAEDCTLTPTVLWGCLHLSPD